MWLHGRAAWGVVRMAAGCFARTLRNPRLANGRRSLQVQLCVLLLQSTQHKQDCKHLDTCWQALAPNAARWGPVLLPVVCVNLRNACSQS